MTYLTRLKVNSARRSTWSLLDRLEPMHAMVEKMFLSDSGRILWRLDHTYEGPVFYVLSDSIPDATAFIENYGWPRLDYDEQVKTVIMDEVFDSLEPDSKFGFRIAVNPAKRNKDTGKMFSLVGRGALEWVTKKLESNGFHVDFIEQVDEAHPELLKNGRRTRRTITSYKGIVTITEPDKARNALTNGIGKSKAYGAGLMTLALV